MRSDERRLILLVGDILAVLISLGVAIVTWGSRDWLDVSWNLVATRVPTWFFFLPLVWIGLILEMYDVRRAGRRDETLKGIGLAAGTSLAVYLLLFFVAEPKDLPRVGVAVFIVAASIFTLAWRFIYIAIFTQPSFLRRVLMVGAGRAGSALAKICREMKPQPFHLVGFIDDDLEKKDEWVEGFQILGTSQDLLAVVEREQISDIIFAISNDLLPDTFRALLDAEERGIEITTMPTVYEQLMGRVPILLLRSDWILRSFVDHIHGNGIYELLKRLMDILGGLVGSLLYILLFPLAAVAVLIETGWPILYRQKRLGQNGAEYSITKFRTMYQDSEKDGKAHVTTENDIRITKVGKLLRKSHLDELPQFYNILKGDMSLVGPRAERFELVKSLQQKVPFYRARLLVKPGLTGWAQVNFGYASTVEDTAVKLEYDLYYIKHRNIFLDLIILIRTIGTVVGFKGQ